MSEPVHKLSEPVSGLSEPVPGGAPASGHGPGQGAAGQRRIAAYGLCRDPAGRLLATRPSAGTGLPGRWRIPGGGVRQGEDPADTVVREFAEETGLVVRVVELVGVTADVGPDPRTGRSRHTDRIVYRVAVRDGTPRVERSGTTDQARYLTEPQLAGVALPPWCARLLGLPAQSQRELSPPPPAPPGPAGPAPASSAARTEPARRPRARQRFGAYGVVTDQAGRYLLTRIAPGYPGADHWHLPGGGTDFGEQPADGLLRELAEETGQHGRVGELIGVRHHHDPAALGPEGHPVDWHVVQALYRVSVDRPTIPVVVEAAGGSTAAAGWFTRAETGALPLSALAAATISACGS